MAMSCLNDHLITRHGGKVRTMKHGNWAWMGPFSSESQKMMKSPRNMAALNGVTFYINKMCLNDHNNAMVWVSYNGPKKDELKYKFKLEVLDKNKDEVLLSGSRFCVPCDTSRDAVKEKCLGIVINKDLADQVNLEINSDRPKFKLNIQFFPARRPK